MSTVMCVDIETYSSNHIKYGVHKYVDADDFEILLFAYCFDDGPVTVVDFTAGEQIPPDVFNALRDPKILKTAYNANFEITCLKAAFGADAVPDDQWECDSVLALYNSLPAGLGVDAKILGFPEDKQKDTRGKALIKYFCVPCSPTKSNGGRTRNRPGDAPDKWEIFKEYNAQDVVTERAIRNALISNRPSPEEHEMWLIDRWINNNGIAIDMTLVDNAIRMNEEHGEVLMEEARQLTGLDNPNSPLQLKKWLGTMLGEEITCLDKAAIADLLSREIPEPVRRLLTIRQSLGNTSVKKYQAMKESVCSDGRIHDLFQFYGAQRTGRFAGRNVQLQNLPRNYMSDLDDARNCVIDGDTEMMEMLYNVPDTLKQLVRTALVAPDGTRFVVADFSAIEARVIAWVAQEKWRQDAFANGEDIYCASASQMFHCKVVKHGENGELRQKGKIAELALGYGGGIAALKNFGADKMGLSDPELEDIVQKWRAASPRIPKLWHELENAALECIRTKRTIHLPQYRNIALEWFEDSLMLVLPTGRKLRYKDATIASNKFDKPAIIFKSMNQQAKKWAKTETWGGKLTENLIQAIARDCLCAAMKRLKECKHASYKICAHIHDEVVLEVPKGEGSLEDAVAIMTQNEPWNEGLLMNADGFENNYYMKD
ncbi:DNA polymerase [Selenomonas sp. FC4001]|uniref:DNA polymerase n=1 Tax=Selenomonas sp. FC4001 TaxID=1408313 RepID=UPI000562E3C0|nr:DNA polymerase [Selenomonas sp. FC4001]